ncbi:hypothetical protein [Paenibacillus sp. EKM212P]|uniref:hypothetical protein n=1 Tax=Paenibacillus sp. EKM212P TaxID=1683680 RepID=UPI00406BFECE
MDGLGEQEQLEQLHRFAEDIIPVLRREIPSTIWQQVPNLHKENGSLAAIPKGAPSISPIFQL